jgi:O-antigen ligase
VFLGLRLHEPLGYINGQGAFFVMSTWLFLAAAEQRRWPLLSGAGLAAAVLTAALALLSQSRGVALAALLAAVVALALVPGRVRRAWTVAALAAALAPALPALLAVYDSGTAGVVDPATLDDAGRAALLCALVAGIAWGALTAAAASVERRAPVARRLAAGVVAVAAVAGVVVAVASAGTVERTVSDQYHAFVHLAPEESDPSSRLLSGSGQRYDYWRIAWAVFRENPVGGVGAGNYPEPYFARRTRSSCRRWPSSGSRARRCSRC